MKKTFGESAFQMWEYHVSHGELLVRSPRHGVDGRNRDLMFFGVEYVELPRHLPNLELDDPTEKDLARACERLGRQVESHEVTALVSRGIRYIVVAAGVQVRESEMDIFDSPFRSGDGTRALDAGADKGVAE
jgi:hypothetical protein